MTPGDRPGRVPGRPRGRPGRVRPDPDLPSEVVPTPDVKVGQRRSGRPDLLVVTSRHFVTVLSIRDVLDVADHIIVYDFLFPTPLISASSGAGTATLALHTDVPLLLAS